MMKTIIATLVKKFFPDTPDDKKKLLICVVILVVLLAACVFIFGGSNDNVGDEMTRQQMHEIERTERVINILDEKTKLEVEKNEAIRIDTDNVLSVIDSLVSGRAKR